MGIAFQIFRFRWAVHFSFVDLNSIPLAAIDRIEILKDGASAIYGDDAVAGVVNVILKNEYNGADIYNYYGISQRDDYEVFHSQVTGGVSHKLWSDDSKLSIVAAFDYYSQSPIDALDRWYRMATRANCHPSIPIPRQSSLGLPLVHSPELRPEIAFSRPHVRHARR
jgi:iron complex outermembrane receptor protein